MQKGQRDKRLYAVFFILGSSLTLLVVSLGTCVLIHHAGAGWWRPLRAGASGNPPTLQGQIGPWGIIEPIEIPLTNPDGLIPDQDVRLQDPKWFFEKYSESDLTRFLRSCDLQNYQQQSLLDRSCWHFDIHGIAIYPPEPIVWSLSPKARQQIYSRLALSSSNYAQCFAFRFPVDAFELKLEAAGLAGKQIEKIRRLVYTNGGYLCFADLESVRRVLPVNDFKSLIQALYITPTYFLRVRIPPSANIESVVKYWGKGGREKRILPIINSVAHAPGGAAINVSYLLPTFARLRLYTYPESWNDPTSSRQDCFFTSMNFFNETPDTNFFDSVYSRKILDTAYQTISDTPIFGDLVTIFNETGEAIHTCIYIADDFVFTKNGINPTQPWVIMRLPDMLLIYCCPERQSRIMFLRRKDLS